MQKNWRKFKLACQHQNFTKGVLSFKNQTISED